MRSAARWPIVAAVLGVAKILSRAVVRAGMFPVGKTKPSMLSVMRSVCAPTSSEPMQAQPPTLGYLLSKALRRHRGRVALVASLLLALLLGTATALTTLALVRINQERKIAVKARDDADSSRKEAESARDGETSARRKSESLKEELRLRLDVVPIRNRDGKHEHVEHS